MSSRFLRYDEIKKLAAELGRPVAPANDLRIKQGNPVARRGPRHDGGDE
jgi:hypothetical protein